jgi:16S rRNA (uracil1498-N3)-methyltransferase
MSLHRFFLAPSLCQGPELKLTDAQAHHALRVLRIVPGQHVVLLDGEGHEYLCEVRRTEERTAILRVLQKNSIPPLPYKVTLLQAVPKRKTMDLIIQKATELGAHRIVPLISEHTAVRLDTQNANAKTQKWQLTATETAKQCGAAWLTHVETPTPVRDFLARGEQPDLSLVASLQPDARHPRERFQTYLAEHARLPKTVSIWIGPEGDFTPAELDAIKTAGAHPVSLGHLILRSETAAIYCLSVLNYELQAPRQSSPQPLHHLPT